MTKSGLDAAHWLPEARAGSIDALGQVLEACRGYLLMIAQRELDSGLQGKGGASDLVQETFIDAQRGFARFTGHSAEELRAWLREVLLNNLANFARRFRDTAKREVGRETALPGDSSSSNPAAGISAGTPSPSVQAMEQEQAEALQNALDQLPEDYRHVIRLRYQEERSFEEIGKAMNRTGNAARKLWLRAIERLQELMGTAP